MQGNAVLTLNAGSSSLKLALFDASGGVLFRGAVEGMPDKPHLTAQDAAGAVIADERWNGGDSPLVRAIAFAEAHLGGETLAAVGHRVVHGGGFAGPERVTDGVMAAMERLIPWAPLHQPQNLEAMREIAQHRPDLAQVACFDTAFHSTLDPLAARYPIPAALHDAGLRRYGFHGLSYEFIAEQIRPLNLPRVIVAHLGNGASLCALRGGRSIDTTMGLTPLDGVMMGTRSGAVDPGLVLALLDGRSRDAVTDLLYRQSGLKGVSGIGSDMRELAASSGPAARTAIDLFCFRVAREAGGLAATLGGIDGFVFTGGIGTHDAAVRSAVCARLAWLGLAIDPEARSGGRISPAGSSVQVWCLATDEESMIARHTLRVLSSGPN
jgi:acetate kinase